MFLYGKCLLCGSLRRLDLNKIDYTGYITGETVSLRKVKRLKHLLEQNGVLPGNLILDYGCGKGALVRALQEAGYQAEGYEPFSDIHAMTLQQGKTYAAIILTHVFEHLPSYDQFMARLQNCTQPGSKVITIHPSASRFPALDPKNPFQQWAVHAPFHELLPSDAATTKFFAEAGFVLKRFFPYDVQRSGFWENSNASALLFQAKGGVKEKVLQSHKLEKVGAVLKHPLLFASALFFRTKDELVSTMVFERR